MEATISLEGLWQAIRSMSLSNQKWLSERLVENINSVETEYIDKEEILSGIDSGLSDLRHNRKISFDEFVKVAEHAV